MADSSTFKLVRPQRPEFDGHAHVSAAPTEREAPAVGEELRRWPELAAALASQRASFDTYVRTRFLASERFNADVRSRDVHGRSSAAMLAAYEHASGRICGSYYCENLIGASARTDCPRFALVFNSQGWGQEEELLTSCDGLYWEGIDYLAGSDRTTFVERLYSVATDVLSVLDARCAPADRQVATGVAVRDRPRLRAQALEALGRKLQDVRDFYAAAAAKRARLRYLGGVAAGLAATIALAAVLLIVLWASDVVSVQDRAEIITIWIAGGLGAVVSVMQRVSSDSLELHHEAGRSELVVVGAIRPLLGAALAVAIYALFAGGILAFAAPTAGSDPVYWFAGIGFLSGFSERFAQDMLVRTHTGLSRSQSGPPAGPASSGA